MGPKGGPGNILELSTVSLAFFRQNLYDVPLRIKVFALSCSRKPPCAFAHLHKQWSDTLAAQARCQRSSLEASAAHREHTHAAAPKSLGSVRKSNTMERTGSWAQEGVGIAAPVPSRTLTFTLSRFTGFRYDGPISKDSVFLFFNCFPIGE